jgi:hypothetical protein
MLMLNYVYTMVFSQELPDNKAVKQMRKELRRIFEAEEVSTNDNRRFSFTVSARMAEAAVIQFGHEHRRKFVLEGLSIKEEGWTMCGHPERF